MYLTYIVMGLRIADQGLGVALKFVTNESVVKVLTEVDGLVKTAIGLLGGVSAQVEKGIDAGDIDPADPELGGIEAKKESK